MYNNEYIQSQQLLSAVNGTYMIYWENPEFIIEKDILCEFLMNLPILQISRIISSVQRLSDIIYASNFGYLKYSLNSEIIESMYANPIENRTNIPKSVATELIKFHNFLVSLSDSYLNISKKMRKINHCAKPLNDVSAGITMVSTSSDVIKQILSVVQHASELTKTDDYISIMLNLITDPSFTDQYEFFFDPDFELLHAPLIPAIQTTYDKLRLHLSSIEPRELD